MTGQLGLQAAGCSERQVAVRSLASGRPEHTPREKRGVSAFGTLPRALQIGHGSGSAKHGRRCQQQAIAATQGVLPAIAHARAIDRTRASRSHPCQFDAWRTKTRPSTSSVLLAQSSGPAHLCCGRVPQFGTPRCWVYGIETHVKHDVHASESGSGANQDGPSHERLRIPPWLRALKP
jgi:hypothetical protein